MGYKIAFIANSCTDALQKHSNAKTIPDTIIIDTDFSSLGEIETIKEITAIYPDAKIIFISEDESIENEAIEAGATYFIKTPSSLKDFLKHLDDGHKRPRGRPAVPEEEKKTRVTFSVTKKVVDEFNDHCLYTKEDSNRVIETLLIDYVKKQNSMVTKAKKLDELSRKQKQIEEEIKSLEHELMDTEKEFYHKNPIQIHCDKV
jgi:DNA-binding NarL/FixJ family response regulator